LKKHIILSTEEKPDFVSPLNLFKASCLKFTPMESSEENTPEEE